jgi:hypothetical protein
LIQFTSAIPYSLKAIEFDEIYAVVKLFEDRELIEQCAKVLKEEEHLRDERGAWDDSSLCSDSDSNISDLEFQGLSMLGDGSHSKESPCLNPVQKVLYILSQN